MDKELLTRIANHQMLQASFLLDVGVFKGKMGADIFFYHAARFTTSSLWEEYADELLEEIFEDMCDITPVSFSNGLCGIGWGIEYLVKEGFVEGQTDDTLIDIDKKIMEVDLRRITDYSFETGLEGIACYALSRLQTKRSQGIPFDEVYLDELFTACCNSKDKGKYTLKLMEFVNEKKSGYSFEEILSEILNREEKEQNEFSWRTGLKILLQ